MEESYDDLIEMLQASIKKNGEKPLTNVWLLNILKKIQSNHLNQGLCDANECDIY